MRPPGLAAQLRRAMVRPGRDNLTGEIEVDETYVGGAEEGKRGRGAETKAIIAVAAEKSGRGTACGASKMIGGHPDNVCPGRRCAGGDDPHRRLAWLQRAGGGWLSAPRQRHKR